MGGGEVTPDSDDWEVLHMKLPEKRADDSQQRPASPGDKKERSIYSKPAILKATSETTAPNAGTGKKNWFHVAWFTLLISCIALNAPCALTCMFRPAHTFHDTTPANMNIENPTKSFDSASPGQNINHPSSRVITSRTPNATPQSSEATPLSDSPENKAETDAKIVHVTHKRDTSSSEEVLTAPDKFDDVIVDDDNDDDDDDDEANYEEDGFHVGSLKTLGVSAALGIAGLAVGIPYVPGVTDNLVVGIIAAATPILMPNSTIVANLGDQLEEVGGVLTRALDEAMKAGLSTEAL